MDRHASERRERMTLRQRAALWYVLASSYAAARLLVSKTVSGVWELDASFVVGLLATTFVQLVVLELVALRVLGRSPRRRDGGPPCERPP